MGAQRMSIYIARAPEKTTPGGVYGYPWVSHWELTGTQAHRPTDCWQNKLRYTQVQGQISYKDMCFYIKLYVFCSSTRKHAESLWNYFHNVISRLERCEILWTVGIWTYPSGCPGVQDLSSGCPERRVLVSRPGFFVAQKLQLLFSDIKFIYFYQNDL